MSGTGADTSNTSVPALDNGEVLEAIGRLDEKLQGLETRIASIETEVRNDPNTRNVANRLFEHLPTKAELLYYEKSVA